MTSHFLLQPTLDYFLCPVPFQVRTNKQTYRETYRWHDGYEGYDLKRPMEAIRLEVQSCVLGPIAQQFGEDF